MDSDLFTVRVRGLGLYSSVEVASHAFVISRAQSCMLPDHILRDSGVYGMDLNFDRALDGHSVVIPDFDLNSFTSKDTVPPKA